MNEPLIAALDRALKGDGRVLSGLGIEERVVSLPEWDDRIAVDGAGAVTYTSRRPTGDSGGDPIGVFRDRMEKKELMALIRAMRQIAAAPPPVARSEAYELRILLSAVAEGHIFEISEPANGEALEPLRSVLDPLQNAIGKAIDHPVRSLTVAIELPDGVAWSGGTPVVVHLRNAGEQGAWVANPLTLPNVADRDRAELIYRKPMVFTPGIAPAPEPLNRAPLLPRMKTVDEPRYLWVPTGGDVPVPMQAEIKIGDAKELAFRAALFMNEGDEIVAGQPRIRGTVFSADVKVPIK